MSETITVEVRCSAVRPNGERCTRMTTKGPMCAQHLKSVLGVEIRESVIPKAGMGLFTTRARVYGENIVSYDGDIIIDLVADDEAPPIGGQYVVQIKKNTFIDARKSNYVGRYANAAARTGWKNNAQLVYDRHARIAWIRCTDKQGIAKDHEIFCSYGSKYWREETQPASLPASLPAAAASSSSSAAAAASSYAYETQAKRRPALRSAKTRQQRLAVKLKAQQKRTADVLLSEQDPPDELQQKADWVLRNVPEGEILAAGLGQSIRNPKRGMDSQAILGKLYDKYHK